MPTASPPATFVAVQLQAESWSSGDSITSSQADARQPSRRGPVLLWLAWGALVLGTLDFAAVRRTQEARVLETAREMLGGGVEGWIIPHLNGEVRLHKPPLAYWLSAIGFKIFGVSEWSGRLPGALAGWLTVGATFIAAKELFNARAAFFAAAALAGSSLFCRHSQLAETDGMTALFVTVAVVCFWRASEGSAGRLLLWHLGSAAVGLAAMSKGPPALFPVIFLIALEGVSRRWGILWQWIRSGAPVTVAAIAVPWWIAAMTIGSRVVGKELHDVLGGQDHFAWFFIYVPFLLVAVAPWSLFVPVSLAACSLSRYSGGGLGWGLRRLRQPPPRPSPGVPGEGERPSPNLSRTPDPQLQGLLLWILAIFVPLCLTGNKQPHYLLPMLPPLMILVGWFMDAALRGHEDRWAGIATICFGATWVGCVIAAAAMVVVPRVLLHRIRAGDVVLAAAILMLAGVVQVLYRRRNAGEAFGVFAAGCSALLSIVIGVWSPSLNLSNSRDIATSLRSQFGSRPYRFYGEGAYLPVCFAMRAEIPYVNSPGALRQVAVDLPNVVVLVQADPKARNNTPLPEFPPGMVKVATVGDKEELLDVYQFANPPATQE